MSRTGIILVYADDSADPLVQASLADDSLEPGDTLHVYDSGRADRIEVAAGAAIQAHGGTVSDAVILATTTTTLPNGLLKVYGGAVAEDVTVAGSVLLFSGGTLKEALLTDSARLNATEGTLANIRLQDASGFNIIGGSLEKCEIGAGSQGILDGNVIVEGLVVHSGASLIIGSGVTFKGTLSIGAALTQNDTTNADDATADFLLTELGPSTNVLLDWSKCAFGTVELSVSDGQAAGTYSLAGNAAGFAADVSLCCREYEAKKLSVGGEAVTYHNAVYSLSVNEGTLSAEVESYATTGSAEALNWGVINGSRSYTLEIASGTQSTALTVETAGVELFGLADGDYTWQVRNTAEADNWQTGAAFTQSAAATEPQKYTAESNGAEELFFASAEETWGAGYMAQHVGNSSWSGTGETVVLEGYARITNIFAGSEDASTLICRVPDATASGDFCCVPDTTASGSKGIALFLDDIYSAFPSCVPEASASERLSQINTILATDSDDLIDLTSQRFEFANGLCVEGGAGDDVIWANSGTNTLLGGGGDDRIVGGSGDDFISGGAGDDRLHGGGGSDTFYFEGTWGNDTICQTDDGTITLWVAGGDDSHWDATARIYSDGTSTITVTGTAAVTRKY